MFGICDTSINIAYTKVLKQSIDIYWNTKPPPSSLCANVTFHSFAAEVEFHADALYSWEANVPIAGDYWYECALRADMAIGEDAESGYYDEYYDLTSDIVIAQAAAHTDY